MTLFSDADKEVRFTAVEALGLIGPKAKEAVPALIELLHDEDELVRHSAGDVLKRIDPSLATRAGEP